jgi:hypothetical protein
MLAHRLSWFLQHGPVDDGLFVCHHCDNPLCVNPAHLFVSDQSGNMADMVAKGRANRPAGILNPNSKLTPDIVNELRELYSRGERSISQVADRYGISKTQAARIIRGESW